MVFIKMTIAFVVYFLTFIKVSIFSDIIKITHTHTKSKKNYARLNLSCHIILVFIFLVKCKFILFPISRFVFHEKNQIKCYKFFAILHIPLYENPNNPFQDIISLSILLELFVEHKLWNKEEWDWESKATLKKINFMHHWEIFEQISNIIFCMILIKFFSSFCKKKPQQFIWELFLNSIIT